MGYPINNTYTYLTFLSVPTIDGLKTIIRYLDDKIIFIRIEPDDRMHRNWTLAYYYNKVQIRRNVTKQSIMLCVVVHTEMRTCRYLILADFIAHCVEWPRYTLKKRFKYFKLEKKKNTEKENESRRVRKKSVLPPFWSTHSLCCATPSLLLMQIRTFQVEDVDDALALSASFFLLSSTLSLSLSLSLFLSPWYIIWRLRMSARCYIAAASAVMSSKGIHPIIVSLSSLYFLV